MSETVFSLLKGGEGEKLRSRSWHGHLWESCWLNKLPPLLKLFGLGIYRIE